MNRFGTPILWGKTQQIMLFFPSGNLPKLLAFKKPLDTQFTSLKLKLSWDSIHCSLVRPGQQKLKMSYIGKAVGKPRHNLLPDFNCMFHWGCFITSRLTCKTKAPPLLLSLNLLSLEKQKIKHFGISAMTWKNILNSVQVGSKMCATTLFCAEDQSWISSNEVNLILSYFNFSLTSRHWIASILPPAPFSLPWNRLEAPSSPTRSST